MRPSLTTCSHYQFRLSVYLPLVAPVPHSWRYRGPDHQVVRQLLARVDGWSVPACDSCAGMDTPRVRVERRCERDGVVALHFIRGRVQLSEHRTRAERGERLGREDPSRDTLRLTMAGDIHARLTERREM